ncbi:unnamed protein product [Lupinus luteus]|uniref:Uncharacterized protein n=1 Tax=Lupinus luteus TaxID=3873 RepID=A0AAV1WBJ3_LUPLU
MHIIEPFTFTFTFRFSKVSLRFSKVSFTFQILSNINIPSVIQILQSFKVVKQISEQKRKGTVGIIEIENPNLVKAKNVKAKDVDKKKLQVLVAGGGIGGLVFALAAKRMGFEVVVFERDISAIRGEGQYRGPIQRQSNALAALESINPEVANQVMRVGCITGNRINGIVDGISGPWENNGSNVCTVWIEYMKEKTKVEEDKYRVCVRGKQ